MPYDNRDFLNLLNGDCFVFSVTASGTVENYARYYEQYYGSNNI